jgi:hypothetical protein
MHETIRNVNELFRRRKKYKAACQPRAFSAKRLGVRRESAAFGGARDPSRVARCPWEHPQSGTAFRTPKRPDGRVKRGLQISGGIVG